MNGPPGMGMNPGTGGPVGAPQMNQQQQQMAPSGTNMSQLSELQARLNTYIYDHLVHSKQYECARTFKRFNSVRTKSEQGGTTPQEQIPENAKRPDDVEDAELIPHHGEHSFLMDWFCMFWDTYRAARSQPTYRNMSIDYMTQQRLRANLINQNDPIKARTQMGMNGMKGMPPRNPQQMQAEMLQRQRTMQMQRDGQMEAGAQRPQTPGSMGDNAPSPSKKPRLDNGADFGGPGMGPGGRPMGNPMMSNGMDQQMAGFQGPNGQPKMEGMNGMPNPMAGQGLENPMEFMQGRALGGGGGQPQDGRHALQDYQLQLMLLEQQNKKRLLQARREQDTISTNLAGPGAGPGPGPGGMMNNGVFAPNMSPQGSRGGGPSPNPADMKRGTPKMAQSGLPGSPMPDSQQRGSPGGPGFDPSNGQIPPGMPANYYQQMNTMRPQPQTSHPNFQMQVPGMNAQQIDQMNRMNTMNHVQNGRLPNGQMPPGAQNMAFNGQNAAMAQQQRQGAMPPPPAPTDGSAAQPPQRTESSPAQSAAPPTPSQANKAAPKKKETAAQKKKNAPKKGAGATAATPTESADAPVSTPATPMTPSVRDQFPKSGAPAASTTQTQAAPVAQVSQPIDHNAGMFDVPGVGDEFSLEFANVGSSDVLDNFDFDSFLTNDDASGGFTFEGMDMSTEIGSGGV